MTRTGRIVADGRDRLADTPEYEASRQRILEEAESRFGHLIESAGFFGRLRAGHERSRWIRQELEKLATWGALYVRR